MKNNGPSASLKTVGISHFYLLSTLPVSLEGEDPLPLLLTDKAGVFTRDGKRAGLYSTDEREAALLHHRSFMKRENAIVSVDDVTYTFMKTESDGSDIRQIHTGTTEIFLMNNYSVTRFAVMNPWNDGELISALSTLRGISERMRARLTDLYQKAAAEGQGLSEQDLEREKIQRKTDEFMKDTWMYMIGVVVPEIVEGIRSGRIDAMVAVTKLTKGEPL